MLDHYLYSISTKTLIPLEKFTFADREIKYICPPIHDERVLLIAPSYPFVAMQDVVMMTSAVHRSNPGIKISYLIPYMGYARQDKPKEGESFGLQMMCDIIDMLGFEYIFTIHPHTDLSRYFKTSVINIDIYPFLSDLFSKEITPDCILVAPDTGAGKFVEKFAMQYGYSYIVGEKSRTKENSVASVFCKDIVKVKGNACCVIDDIYDTGGTLSTIAGYLKDNGATSVIAYCTHGLCNGLWHDHLDKDNLNKLFVTNTVLHSKHNKLFTVDIHSYMSNYALNFLLNLI